MRILVVAATQFEILPLLEFLSQNFKQKSNTYYQKDKLEIQVLITGIGLMHTAFALAWVLRGNPMDWALHLGIAGALNTNLKIGDVLNIISEQQADWGVEEANGELTDFFDLQLTDWNQTPYINGKLYNPNIGDFDFLPTARALSVNKVHGTTQSIAKLKTKYEADIETMEGAAFFYSCLVAKIDFLQIRSISNYVEERDKENWNIPLAVENLNKTAQSLLEVFSEKS